MESEGSCIKESIQNELISGASVSGKMESGRKLVEFIIEGLH